MREKPTRYFVRVFTRDPEEIGPDSEEDFDARTLDWAGQLLADFRKRHKNAALCERRNIRPDTHDGMIIAWDFETVVLRDAHEALATRDTKEREP